MKHTCIFIYLFTISYLYALSATGQQSARLGFFDQATVYSICEDQKGALWFSTFYNGIVIFDGESIFNLTKEGGLNSDMVQSLLIDNSDNIWIGLFDAGVSFLSGWNYYKPKFTHFTNKEGLSNNEIYTIFQDKKGNLWFGCIGGGVTFLDKISKKFIQITEDRGMNNNYVQAIYEDKNGNMWFGTRGGGISILTAGQNLADKKVLLKFKHFTTENGLSHNEISVIMEDKAGNIWIGTQGGGINKLAANQVNSSLPKFIFLNKKDGLNSNKILSILEDRSGNIWFGTDGDGISCYNGNNFKHYSVNDGLSHNIILTMLEDRAGNLWFGTEGGGITKYDGKQFIHFSEKYAKKELLRTKKLEKAKITEEKYQQTIKTADKAFKSYDYQTAKKSYKLALEIKPNEKYPKIKIKEIDKIIAAIKAEEKSLSKVKKEIIKKGTNKDDDALTKSKVAALMHKKDRDTKLEAKKNLLRKSEYEKEILKALAEEENKKKLESTMAEGEEIAALQQLKHNKEATKIQQAYRKNEKEKSIQTIKNKQRKDEYEKTIILALAEAEQIKEQRSSKPVLPKKIGTNTLQYQIRPEIITRTEKDAFKTKYTTIIKFPHREVKLQKINYIWGNVDYFKNDVEIDEKTFFKELEKFEI
ncbi:MAG: hypothetical protein FVQ77_03665 [Cytophagales bacterium]|nr:hypothetical protein [Cytophagales bacterium]